MAYAWEYYNNIELGVVDEQYPDISINTREYIQDGDVQYTLSPNLAWSREGSRRRMYIRYELPPSDYRSVSGFSFDLTFMFTGGAAGTKLKYTLLKDPESFRFTDLTWNTQPELAESYVGSVSLNTSSEMQKKNVFSGSFENVEVSSKVARDIVASGVFVIELPEAVTGNFRICTYSYNSYSPSQSKYLSPLGMNVSDTLTTYKIRPYNSPTSGYLNKFQANTFAWWFYPDNAFWSIKLPTQLTATLSYRSGTSGTWDEVSVTSEMQVTLPANSITGQTAQWTVSAVDTDGNQSSIGPFTLTTTAAPIAAIPVSPKNNIEDNRAPINFIWALSSTDGGEQKAFVLQYSTDAASWTTLANRTSSDPSFQAPANTFDAGTIFWRVQILNTDNIAGDYSEIASFTAFGAPETHIVTATSVNYATISWQASGQEAYRITIDGKQIGPFFGTAKRYELADPLSFGEHVATVEVQNSFGLWSQPGTVTFTVTSGGGSSPIVTGRFRADAELSWSVAAPDALTGLFVYRDGVRIASLDYSQGSGVFVDRHVLGEHSYQIIGRWFNGYAIYSDVITGRMCAKCPLVAPLAGGEWLTLRLSETAERSQAFNAQRAVSLRHFSGAELPVAEVGPYRDISGSYEASFADREQAETFEALFGQVVILKTRGDKVMVGVMSNLDTRVTKHYIAYSFTVQQIYWRDYINAAGD